MELTILAAYTIVKNFLISIGHHTDPQPEISDAEF